MTPLTSLPAVKMPSPLLAPFPAIQTLSDMVMKQNDSERRSAFHHVAAKREMLSVGYPSGVHPMATSTPILLQSNSNQATNMSLPNPFHPNQRISPTTASNVVKPVPLPIYSATPKSAITNAGRSQPSLTHRMSHLSVEGAGDIKGKTLPPKVLEFYGKGLGITFFLILNHQQIWHE